MESIVNTIATDAKPSEISAAIKDALFAKAAEKIEAIRPHVASSLFDGGDEEGEE